jgi:hypothetical protein
VVVACRPSWLNSAILPCELTWLNLIFFRVQAELEAALAEARDAALHARSRVHGAHGSPAADLHAGEPHAWQPHAGEPHAGQRAPDGFEAAQRVSSSPMIELQVRY